MNSQPPKQKNFTQPLKRWLLYAIGSFVRCNIEMEDALIIAEIDNDEEFCHVEFPSKENDLTQPRIWYIKEWRDTYAAYIRKKASEERNRRHWNIRTENINRVQKALCRQFNLEPNDVLAIAAKIVDKKQYSKAELLGVKMERIED